MNESPINSKNKKNITKKIILALKQKYPNAKTDLLHNSPFELLIATMLSAQCTDKRVNMVIPYLFEKYPTADALAIASNEDVENIIKSVGFYKNKAKNIINASEYIVQKFNSKVPLKMEYLVTLPGVGRKTANCVLGNYSKPEGIVVDTHVIRIANLLGLVSNKNAEKIELELMNIIEKKY